MAFLGCNILGSLRQGSNIYQPIGGTGLSCDYTLYSDGTNEYFIPFVPCDQLYVEGDPVLVTGSNLAIGDS